MPREASGVSRYILSTELPTLGVREARIHSLERSLYIVELDTALGNFWLGTDAHTRAVFRNLSAARAALGSTGAFSVTLVHASAYDEMVGLGPRADNRIEISLVAETPGNPDQVLP